jgi:DNA-binding beta-propeller fold protein YncE
MWYRKPVTFTLALALFAGFLMTGARPSAKSAPDPAPNSQPNPYRPIENWAQLPEGRKWGSTVAVDIDRDGRSIWVFDRCGAGTCLGSSLPPLLHFDPSGRLLKSFGEGMFVWPHGLFVDRDGNVWVTDGQGREGKGQQVIKFSPDGKILMTLGKPGVGVRGTDTFNQPNDVVLAPNGEIFVADGHDTPANSADSKLGGNVDPRIVKFTKDGKFIKAWGKSGKGPGEFDGLHGLALDSRGRLFVADRGNNRIQIFDQEGKFLAEWKQFGRPSGIFISKNDTIYVTDTESGGNRAPGSQFKMGLRIGSAKDGSVAYFIPDDKAPEGVAVDPEGTIYGSLQLKKWVKK